MPNSFSYSQLVQYQDFLNQGGISGFYSVMLAHGYNYAGWAKGVADGNTRKTGSE